MKFYNISEGKEISPTQALVGFSGYMLGGGILLSVGYHLAVLIFSI